MEIENASKLFPPPLSKIKKKKTAIDERTFFTCLYLGKHTFITNPSLMLMQLLSIFTGIVGKLTDHDLQFLKLRRVLAKGSELKEVLLKLEGEATKLEKVMNELDNLKKNHD